jgi:hypothetical protein
MLVTGRPLVTVLAIIPGNNIRMADTALNHGLRAYIMMTGSRLALVADVAILLKNHGGMTVLADLAIGRGGVMVTVASGQQGYYAIRIDNRSPVLGVVTGVTAGNWLDIKMAGFTADIFGVRRAVVD